MMSNPIGIMQGRLVPPTGGRIQAFPAGRWQDEFPAARVAGVSCIEWIFDESDGGGNPFRTSDGIREVQQLAERHGIAVRSLCADFLMDRPLLRVDEDAKRSTTRVLHATLDRCSRAGINRVVLPFVDQSAIHSEDEIDHVVGIVEDALASTHGVELHLELALGPRDVAALLARLPDPRVKINYDSGNSASLGYEPADEFEQYGGRIGSVHIKDRRRGGGTVPLGQGDANLPLLFHLLRDIRYEGDLILQVARDADGGEVEWARHNRGIVERLMNGG